MATSPPARMATRFALLLAVFSAFGIGLVVLTHELTHGRIESNRRENLRALLSAVLPPDGYDNDVWEDVVQLHRDSDFGGGSPVSVYRARRNGVPVAIATTAVAPDGYGGPIRLLIGIDYAGVLSGVRVLAHRETPGLGDALEIARSDWILALNGRSLSNPAPRGWHVKRDGGDFDQFTGATITPRAVVNSVRRVLEHYAQHRSALFDTPAGQEIENIQMEAK